MVNNICAGQRRCPVQRTNPVRTIGSEGNSATTPQGLVNNDDVHLMLLLLAESVASRMLELGVKFSVVEVYVRDSRLISFPSNASSKH